MYRYVHNLQGDIVAIVDTAGNLVVEYKYDAWGDTLSITRTLKTTLGQLNPFRYRGYVWDTELGLYWLESRCYNPKMLRFMNADGIDNLGTNTDILDFNSYTYCINQPIVFYDPTGEAFSLIAGLVSAVVNVATTFISAKVTSQDYSWKDAAWAAASGFANAFGIFGKFIGGAISGYYTFQQGINSGFSVGQALLCGVTSGVATTLSISNLGALDNIPVNATLDLVFGTGYNSVSAAVYAGTRINVDRETQKKITSSCSTEAARKEKIALKKAEPVKKIEPPVMQRYGGYRNMQMELSYM